ncbi:hypothetical protein Z046_06225 [Pseudomonas aeruginosa VRFPA09]|nr:hypothetical protein Z046_06225 [Pseudomonas aeruginosa VRFPA09]
MLGVGALSLSLCVQAQADDGRGGRGGPGGERGVAYAPAAEVANGYRRAMAACLSGRGYSVN